MGRSWLIYPAAIMAIMMLLTLVPPGEAKDASDTVVFSTDFEGVGFFITEWEPLGWSRGDYAAGHDDDLWCRLNSTLMEELSGSTGANISAHSFSSALYGNRLGKNEANGKYNLENGYPDPGMDSWVRLAPPKAAYYDGMTLTFWYWARTGDIDKKGPLTDALLVNINDGATTTKVWEQPSPDSQGWQKVTLDLPAGTLWMEWEFKTGDTPAGGPYPGVLIDDVAVTTASEPSGHPFSMVGGMSEYYDRADIKVPMTMSDARSYSLYYRSGDGGWTPFTDDDHKDGLFSGPATFRAPGDGRYELFSVAKGNDLDEDMKRDAEAVFTIDTIAPTVALTAPSQGTVTGPGALSLEWTSDDQGSGVSRTEVRIDDRTWATVTSGSYLIDQLSEGMHTATVKVTDKAGATSESSVVFASYRSVPAMVVLPMGPNTSLDTPVTVNFLEAVDRGSVSMEVSDLPGERSWSGDTITFTPTAPLEPEKTYSATITGNRATGEPFTVDWSFSTVKDQGGISGIVRDSEGAPVANASVVLSNGLSTVTDHRGYFEIAGITPGSYTLTITSDQYGTMSTEVKVVAGQIGELGDLELKTAVATGAGIGFTTALLLTLAVAAPSLILLTVLRRRREK